MNRIRLTGLLIWLLFFGAALFCVNLSSTGRYQEISIEKGR